MSLDSSFYLYKLTDKELDNILSLTNEEIAIYIGQLIEKFYQGIEPEKAHQVYNAYRGSFVLEKIIRNSPIIQESFTPIYTKSGLIREIVNDLYSIGSEKLALN
jgi:hypothetical protein